MKNLVLDKNIQQLDYYLIAKLPVVIENEIILLPISQITRVEANGNYSKIFSISHPFFQISKSLIHFEETLPKSFLRVHDKHIINIKLHRENILQQSLECSAN